MKYLIFLSFVGLAMSQRPTYAGASPKGYPELASRFKDSTEDQNLTQVNSSISVANRIGEGDDQSQNIPLDARGDVNLVNRLNNWPRDNRPFWLLNAQHIENLRNPERANNSQQTNQGNQEVRFKNQQIQQSNEDRRFVFVSQPNSREKTRVQSRFGESLDTETRTIRPNSQRGSFAGNHS
ncbi:unnamed protein product [Ceutorhynchus assimilis]|uniref:Uncharacterized protein n=1 Tax=Ceutorhynchus assimilis TaxID=467358 RepID=A0A9P0DK29_9CUCU|nr:unnamed protein product [Ceutorhynchus assimilis]